MLDFQTLLQTVEQASFSQAQWDQLRQAIDKRDHTTVPIPQNSSEWFSGLNAAIDQFWEGVSAEEKAALIAAWNRNDEPYSDDSHLFDWINELPKGEDDLSTR